MLTGRWDSFQPWCDHVKRQSTQAVPLYSTCCWLEVSWWGSQTDRKKAGRGAHMGEPAHTHMCTDINIEYTLICTVIYRYLHWTSNFWGLEIQSALFSHLKSCVFVQRRSSSALYLLIFLSAQCHSQVLPALPTLFFQAYKSESNWIFHNLPNLCCFCTTRLNATNISWICVKCYNRLLREKL